VPDAEVIAAITRGWTSTPEDCWFCAWDGFGWDSAVEYAAFTATGTPPEIVREPKPDPVAHHAPGIGRRMAATTGQAAHG
jgi:hypothetical protein